MINKKLASVVLAGAALVTASACSGPVNCEDHWRDTYSHTMSRAGCNVAVVTTTDTVVTPAVVRTPTIVNTRVPAKGEDMGKGYYVDM